MGEGVSSAERDARGGEHWEVETALGNRRGGSKKEDAAVYWQARESERRKKLDRRGLPEGAKSEHPPARCKIVWTPAPNFQRDRTQIANICAGLGARTAAT